MPEPMWHNADGTTRVIEMGFIDFPTAFEIVADADTAGAVHHDRCSWHAGMLCDCDVLTGSPEYLAVHATEQDTCHES